MEEMEAAKKRCKDVIRSIERLPATTNITHSCRRTLLKLAHSDLNFVSSLATPNATRSLNIGHLEAVVGILQLPCVRGVSRVCKPLPLSPPIVDCSVESVHVDIVCTLNRKPAWIIVSDRNPKYVSWKCQRCGKNKGLKLRVERLLAAARSSRTLTPSSIVLFFANGLPSFVRQKLMDEFGASEFDFDFAEELQGEWVNVLPWSYRDALALEIKLKDDSMRNTVLTCGSLPNAAYPELQQENVRANSGDAFYSSLLSAAFCSPGVNMEVSSKPWDLLGEGHPLNFDTTALIALVSGISNGHAEKLLSKQEIELKERFKGNFEFVIAQVMSELQSPIHLELSGVLSGKRGIICESVLSEFKELVLMCGGPNEKHRADQLLKCVMVVPDSPSERMKALPTTRKLALKSKIVFGTGDHWHAPTLTANMAFVRAVSQTGMSLFTIEHRPRALTGD